MTGNGFFMLQSKWKPFFLSGSLTSLGSLGALPLLMCSYFTTKPRAELFWWFSKLSFHKTFIIQDFFQSTFLESDGSTVINNEQFPVLNPILVVSVISLGFPCLMQDNGLVLFKQNMVPLSTG